MYEKLIKNLRIHSGFCTGYPHYCDSCTEDECGCDVSLAGQSADAIEELEKSAPRWIPVTEKLPKCEQEVLICTEKKLIGKDAYIDSIVTPAIYEDGTMSENDSMWHWEDIDYAGWDEEEDCGIIPEGWWENRHFCPDGVYNNPVDRKVVAWMPLPEPPKEET